MPALTGPEPPGEAGKGPVAGSEKPSDSEGREGWPVWTHALVAVLTAFVCVLLVAGDEPVASWVRAHHLPVSAGPAAAAPPASDALRDAITPSKWMLRTVRKQYRANLARLRKQLNGSLPSPDTTMEIAFASPIYRLNLRDLGVDPRNMTRQVAGTVLREYRRLVSTNKAMVMRSLQDSDKAKDRDERDRARRDAIRRGVAPAPPAIDGPGSGDGPADGGGDEDGDTSLLNDAFFVWQSEQDGWDIMFGEHKEFEQVKSFWGRAADHFLRSMGHAPVFDGLPRRKQPFLHAWATVHKECVFHGMHHHGEDVMSGVFYVKVPPRAGRITFFDPRGIHAPFLNRITIQPREGDIVLFPSTLVHQVMPTAGTTERISIAVNLLGKQEASARGSDAMPSGLLNPSDQIAVPGIPPDEAYMIE